MPIEVTLVTDRDKGAPTLWQDANGVGARRTYRVNTRDEERALVAVRALHPIGSGLSAAFPFVICRRIGPVEAIGGSDNPSDPDGAGGWSHVPVEFASYSGRASDRPPVTAGSRYTEFEMGSETATAYHEIRPVSFLNRSLVIPVNNGAGAPIEVSTLTIRVHRVLMNATQIGLSTWLALANKINTNRVTLPPLFGTAESLVFEPGELRYRGVRPQVVSGDIGGTGTLIDLVHEVVAAPDHFFRWRLEDAKGHATEIVERAELYLGAEFPEL